MSAKAKGARIERDVVNSFDVNGFAVMKSPSSGSATTRDQPDVLALANGTGWAVEVKYSSKEKIYIDESEITSLMAFADRAGVRPAVACRWKGDTTVYLFDPDDAYRTGSGTYRFDKDTSDEAVTTLLND